jgi:hypothetical protein
MSSVFTGNSDPQSFTVAKTLVSIPTGERAIPLFPASIPPSYQPHYSNTFDLGNNAELLAKLKNDSTGSTVPPTPIANVPAKPLTSATLLTAAINTPASKRSIPNVVQQGVPNFHSAYLANNSFQMTRNGVVQKSTFVEAPMTTNALPQATVKPTPPSFTPLSVSFDLPEENTTNDEPTNYTTYYYIAGGLLIAFFVFGRR